MDDVLLSLVSGFPRESRQDTSYFWNNSDRDFSGSVMQFTWSGEGVLRRGKTEKRCRRGEALLMEHGQPTEYYYPRDGREPWVFTWINFGGASGMWRHLIATHGDVVSFDAEGEAIRLLEEIASRYRKKDFADRYEVSELLGRFLSAVGRELERGPGLGRGPVERARDFLRDHHRRPINIKEAAAHLGISREHLTRIYREREGECPAQYLRHLRLETARRLLRGTSMPLGDIAEQSGFGSPAHFSRAFRAAAGISPSDYRAGKSGRAQKDLRARRG